MARTTTDHDEIREWAEGRGGRPATVVGTSDGGAGILRIDFDDDTPDERLETISWDAFFEKFEDAHLAFLYQDETDGRASRFSKFVARES